MIEEVKDYYAKHLQTTYMHVFTFSRIGWQYFMPNGDIVDLEIIEDTHPTIEFKSKTSDGIEKLLATFNVDRGEVTTGPSVVAVQELLTH